MGRGRDFQATRYLLDYGVAQDRLGRAHGAVVALGHCGRSRPAPYDVQLARVEIRPAGCRESGGPQCFRCPKGGRFGGKWATAAFRSSSRGQPDSRQSDVSTRRTLSLPYLGSPIEQSTPWGLLCLRVRRAARVESSLTSRVFSRYASGNRRLSYDMTSIPIGDYHTTWEVYHPRTVA